MALLCHSHCAVLPARSAMGPRCCGCHQHPKALRSAACHCKDVHAIPAWHVGSGLLALNFAGAVVMALRMPHAFRVPLLVGAQVLFAAYLYWETARVDAARY